MTSLATPTVSAMLPEVFTIASVDWELEDTFTLRFESDNRLEFEPGQIAMISSPGVGEVPISISSDPDDRQHIELTIRATGYVTKALALLRPGSVVGLRGPYGTPWPLDEAVDKDLLVVAGGIGLAPLRSLIYRALARRPEIGNFTLLYGSRDPRSLLFEQELHEWRARFDMEVEITVDRSAPGWMGDVGLVTNLIDRARIGTDGAVAMMCGPEIMMHFVGRSLMERGMEPDDIYLTMERNMKCGIGLCGHCQLGPSFLCKDGPVFPLADVIDLMNIKEL